MDSAWADIDRFIEERLLDEDPDLEEALRRTDAAGIPQLNVAANQGKLLQLLARLAGARLVLELGTLGGYSTIWLARALPPDGRLVTLEAEPTHARVAAENLTRAGVADLVDIRVGDALHTLPELAAEGLGPFDMVFIDADKENNRTYLEWALKLSRTGTLIVVDNVVRGGAVLDPDDPDPSIIGTRELFDTVAGEARLDSTALQTVGAKGHDGFLIGIVEGDR